MGKPASEIDDPATAPISQQISEIDALLGDRLRYSFPLRLEAIFRREMAEARVKKFMTIGIIGIFVYNLFLFFDIYVLPDVIHFVMIVQLAAVTPMVAVLLRFMVKRRLDPTVCVTGALVLIFSSVMLFFFLSQAPTSSFIIFTVPVCLAFGNVVLPLPFKASLFFTASAIVISSIAVLLRADVNLHLAYFAVFINANSGLYMVFGTYRMEMSDRRTYLFRKREALRAELLTENNRHLRKLSETDALTGLLNRRHFDAAINRYCEPSAAPEPLSLMLIDIDHFKRLNDGFGHDAGDLVLRTVAKCLRTHCSGFPEATVARYGGEEFAILLPGASAASAQSGAEQLRAAVARLGHEEFGDGLPVSVTVSIGLTSVACCAGAVPSVLVKSADIALYRAKANGRNRVEQERRRTTGAEASCEAGSTPATAEPHAI